MKISSRNILGIFFAVFATTSVAFAAPPKWQNEANAQTCSESFPERLADFRTAVPAWQQYNSDYERVMPWFREHCRWLSELEIAIRKIDDPAAFVCDTKKGRPKGLTSEFALDHQSPEDLPLFVEHRDANRYCHSYDEGERVSLAVSQADESHVQVRTTLTAMCWNVQSTKCDKARAAMAAKP